MVTTDNLYIIMPVKDAMDMAEQAIQAIVASGYRPCVYDDYSSPETAQRLDTLAADWGIELIHIADHIQHPSPNYRWVLQHAQQVALARGSHLVIIESDVIVGNKTIQRLSDAVREGVGMVAAVTHNDADAINFPYEYASRLQHRHGNVTIATKKRFSFCCTLLTQELLRAVDFSLLDPTKNWYDVTISHQSVAQGFQNLLMLDNPVLHKPHSSRPWKQLKYEHPLRYYWRKLTQHLDKI